MAFTEPITLADYDNADVDFVLQSRLKDGSEWIESDAGPNNIRRISIRHSNAGPSIQKGSKPVRRHLFQFVQEKLNTTLGKTEKLTVNLTITNDPGSELDNTEARHLLSFVRRLVETTDFDGKALRDET